MQQGRHDRPAVHHQYVVSAAGGAGVHDLEADAFFEQRGRHFPRGKFERIAAPEYDHLRLHGERGRKVVRGEAGYVSDGPVRLQLVRGEQQVGADHGFVDGNDARPASPDQQ